MQEQLKKRSSPEESEKRRTCSPFGRRAGESRDTAHRQKPLHFAYPSSQFNGSEKSNEAYEKLLEEYQTDYEPAYEAEFEKQCDFIYKESAGECDRNDSWRYQGGKTSCIRDQPFAA